MKNKKLNLVTKGLLLGFALVSLSACSLFDRKEAVSTSGVKIEKDVNNLEEDSYYTFNGKEYGKLYLGDRSFKESSSGSLNTSSKGNPERVIWLKNDLNSIPVMRRGEKIVFHSSTKLITRLNIERYYDLGYSIGIAKLKENKSTGRFTLDIRDSALTVDPNSDAKQLQDITANGQIIIDSIGDTPLRSGNVSPSGTIIGLEKDKTYAVNAYLGTNLHSKNIKADVRILASSEGHKIEKFDFSGNKTVEFQFPSYYNSGYYLINGFGLVRYISDDKVGVDDEIDMNVPNIYPKAGENGEDVSQKNIQAEDLTTTKVKIATDGEQTIVISYSDPEDKEVKVGTPTAKLISPNGVSVFEQGAANTLTLKTTLEKGEYEIQIIGLHGRNYSYRVTSADGKSTSQESDVAGPPPTDKKADATQGTNPNSSKSLADIVNGH
jgi:hypothetical protein